MSEQSDKPVQQKVDKNFKVEEKPAEKPVAATEPPKVAIPSEKAGAAGPAR